MAKTQAQKRKELNIAGNELLWLRKWAIEEVLRGRPNTEGEALIKEAERIEKWVLGE